MATSRIHVALPDQLIEGMDQLVGPRGRSAFLAELIEQELRRKSLMAFLASEEPGWHDQDHPDLAEVGTAQWVRNLRQESERRAQAAEE